jgi:hypothetical protein
MDIERQRLFVSSNGDSVGYRRAGYGSGGAITAQWPSGQAISISTPLTVGGNDSIGNGGNFLITRLQRMR